MLDEINMSSTRRSSRTHANSSTRITLNINHDTKHSSYTRRTTPTIGTFPRIPSIHNFSPNTHNHASSSSSREYGRTSKRARPRWYRPPPPEAYLIIRAHRRPVGGWGEDWSKKGDGWYVYSLIQYTSNRD